MERELEFKIGDIAEIEAGMIIRHLLVECVDGEIRPLPVHDASQIEKDAVYMVLRLATGEMWAYSCYLKMLGQVSISTGRAEQLLWETLQHHRAKILIWENYEMLNGASGTAVVLDLNIMKRG